MPSHSRTRYLPALTRFDRVRDPDDHVIDYRLPEDPGTPHIITRYQHSSRWSLEPEFGTPPNYFTALCGATVKVILKQDVDLGDEELCQTCVAEAFAHQRE